MDPKPCLPPERPKTSGTGLSAGLRDDLSAGLIVAVMLVPQAMAYAMLAGLPPIVGLYASTIPLFAYAMLGSSRHIAVGPVAMLSVLVLEGVSCLADPGTDRYLSLVLLLTFMVGISQVLLGLFRMGFVLNYLSHAVISGFTSAAAIIISVSQLPIVLGIRLPGQKSIFGTIGSLFERVSEINGVTLLVGLGAFAILAPLQIRWPRFPAQLLVVVIGILSSRFLSLARQGVEIVGQIPAGFPKWSLPTFNPADLAALAPTALVVVFVGFVESVAIAQSIASREKYPLHPNREFIGLGAANLAASFFSGYPVTGGLSRTAMNYQAGARTRKAGIITGTTILLIMALITPVFHHLPRSILAAIIIMAVMRLVDIREPLRLFRIKKGDGWTLMLTFLGVLILGIEEGILAGFAFSMVVFIWRSSHPHMAELGYVERERAFLNILRFPEARTCPGTLIIRIDGAMYFTNTGFIEKRLRNCFVERPELQTVIFNMVAVNDIDAVAIGMLEDLFLSLKEKQVRFVFAEVKGPVRDIMEKAGWTEKFGEKIKYRSLENVVHDLGLDA